MIYVVQKFEGEDWKDICFTYDKGSAHRIVRLIHQNYEYFSVARQRETYAEEYCVPYCEKFLRAKGIVLQ